MKSDSRVSIRRSVMSRRLLCLRESSCLTWPPSTQNGGRHDRVDSPSRAAIGRGRRVGRGHEPQDMIPWLARCSVFKDRHEPARRDSPDRRASPRRRPSSISADAGPLQERRASRSRDQSSGAVKLRRRREPEHDGACPPAAPRCRAPPPARRGSRRPRRALKFARHPAR